MAFGSLLALLDDIAAILDDVSVMTKLAAKKTAGVLGDDLAVNAEKVIGVRPERELPVVWAVAKGAFLNKCILVPAALLIAAFAPFLITPLLVCGGLYLCFEGAEKLIHPTQKHGDDQRAAVAHKLAGESGDLAILEREKIRGAVRTDFILSAEIIVLTLGIVLAGISTLMTIGVYGLVAAIVKIDDVGLLLAERAGDGAIAEGVRAIGRGMLSFAPWFMKSLSVVGTIAMFFVGGGILTHASHTLSEGVTQVAQGMGLAETLFPSLVGAVIGLSAGYIMVKVMDRFFSNSSVETL
jgi:predicted DNA repair protein MutK